MAGTNCPDHEELFQLLTGSLSTERLEQCTTHMDSCTCCQAKLEEIATGGSNLSQLVDGLQAAEPVAESAYWEAIKSLDSNVLQTVVPMRTARKSTASLPFLQAPADSAYLGRLAQFDIMRVLGRGGMGIVLEAFDSRLQRHVAVKVLDPELADDEISRQRFCREARAAASISHENVVAVHQVEKSGEEGLPYLVMQLITGESLEQRLSGGELLPLREVVRIGMQAAHGLAAAHAQGLIHRDIKPGNILLEPPHDRVKLTDFGLARIAEDVKLTRTGMVSGTPLYMAPEQALGEEADQRSDLFSLGAVLYEMTTGKPPFSGNSALAILRQITDSKHRPAREVNPNVPLWLSNTIDRLLAKKPKDRIQSADELAELLDFEWALMKTTSDDVPTVCEFEQRRQTIRNRWIAAGLGVICLTCGLLAGFLLPRKWESPASSVSTATPQAVLGAQAGAVWSVALDDATKTLAMAAEDGSVRLWDLPTASVKATFNAHRGTVWAARFANAGDLLATAGDDGLIKYWNPSQTEPIAVHKHTNAVRGLAFSHQGNQLFAGDRDGVLRVWSLNSDQPLAEAHQPGTIYAVAVSPRDETVATAGTDKIVRLWNAKSLTEKLPLEGHQGPVFGLSFHPGGQRLASVGWDKTIRIWDTRTGSLAKSWTGHNGDIWCVAYSPDGEMLATGGTDGEVKLWNAESGDLIESFLGHQFAVHGIAFNQDGTLLASGGRDGEVRVWKVK